MAEGDGRDATGAKAKLLGVNEKAFKLGREAVQKFGK